MAAHPRRPSTAETQSAVIFNRNELESGFWRPSRWLW